jgi:hypothetical protein
MQMEVDEPQPFVYYPGSGCGTDRNFLDLRVLDGEPSTGRPRCRDVVLVDRCLRTRSAYIHLTEAMSEMGQVTPGHITRARLQEFPWVFDVNLHSDGSIVHVSAFFETDANALTDEVKAVVECDAARVVLLKHCLIGDTGYNPDYCVPVGEIGTMGLRWSILREGDKVIRHCSCMKGRAPTDTEGCCKELSFIVDALHKDKIPEDLELEMIYLGEEKHAPHMFGLYMFSRNAAFFEKEPFAEHSFIISCIDDDMDDEFIGDTERQYDQFKWKDQYYELGDEDAKQMLTDKVRVCRDIDIWCTVQ